MDEAKRETDLTAQLILLQDPAVRDADRRPNLSVLTKLGIKMAAWEENKLYLGTALLPREGGFAPDSDCDSISRGLLLGEEEGPGRSLLAASADSLSFLNGWTAQPALMNWGEI